MGVRLERAADVNVTVRVPPTVVIGLRETDFTGSPTRWTFG